MIIKTKKETVNEVIEKTIIRYSYSCEECDYETPNIYNMYDHLITHLYINKVDINGTVLYKFGDVETARKYYAAFHHEDEKYVRINSESWVGDVWYISNMDNITTDYGTDKRTVTLSTAEDYSKSLRENATEDLKLAENIEKVIKG